MTLEYAKQSTPNNGNYREQCKQLILDNEQLKRNNALLNKTRNELKTELIIKGDLIENQKNHIEDLTQALKVTEAALSVADLEATKHKKEAETNNFYRGLCYLLLIFLGLAFMATL